VVVPRGTCISLGSGRVIETKTRTILSKSVVAALLLWQLVDLGNQWWCPVAPVFR
jgi:hypothetical protein